MSSVPAWAHLCSASCLAHLDLASWLDHRSVTTNLSGNDRSTLVTASRSGPEGPQQDIVPCLPSRHTPLLACIPLRSSPLLPLPGNLSLAVCVGKHNAEEGGKRGRGSPFLLLQNRGELFLVSQSLLLKFYFLRLSLRLLRSNQKFQPFYWKGANCWANRARGFNQHSGLAAAPSSSF